MWPSIKRLRRPLIIFLFLLVVLRAALNPTFLTNQVQSSFDNLFPGKFKVAAVSVDMDGTVHLKHFQIFEKNQALIDAENLHIKVKLLPLLIGTVNVTDIKADDLQFRWPCDSTGRPMWFDVFNQKSNASGKSEPNTKLIVNADVNIKHVNAIYEIPQHNKKTKNIRKNIFRLKDGAIWGSRLKLNQGDLDCHVPIKTDHLKVELAFINSQKEFEFLINAPKVYWSKELGTSLISSIKNTLKFINPTGAYSYNMRIAKNHKTKNVTSHMSARPYQANANERKMPSVVQLKQFGFPLTIEQGEVNLDENGMPIIKGQGMKFYYKDFKGTEYISGYYVIRDNVSNIYVDEIDLGKEQIVNGLPKRIRKIIRSLKLNKPIKAVITYDHGNPEFSNLDIIFENLELAGVAPGLSKLTGRLKLDANFKEDVFEGMAELSSMEVLKIQFGPDIRIPIRITGDVIDIGSKEKPFIANGSWAYATGFIQMIKNGSLISEIDFNGIDLRKFQIYNDLAVDDFTLNGFLNEGKLRLNKKHDAHHKDQVGKLSFKLFTERGKAIDCQESFPVLSFLDKGLDPTAYFKEKTDSQQRIDSGSITMAIEPNKIRFTSGSTLKGAPLDLGLGGHIRFSNQGEIVISPSLSLITKAFEILMGQWVDQTVKWDAENIWTPGKHFQYSKKKKNWEIVKNK